MGIKNKFADVEKDTFIDPLSVEKLMAKRPKAVVCVHYGGFNEKLNEICRENEITLMAMYSL